MDYQTILFEEPEPGLGVLTLNRPERLNAINLQMLDDLYALFRELDDRPDVRVLIMTGAGMGFCSGADLKQRKFREAEAIKKYSSADMHLEHIQKKYAGVIVSMHRLAQPIIAAVKGPAAGGGMSFALASDIVIASPSASFLASFINIGLSGGELGTTYFLPRMVGVAKAGEILMTGRAVDGVEAEKIGLVSRLVEEDKLMDTALETAQVLLGKTPFGLRMTKEAIRQNLNAPSLESAIEFENRNQSIGCTTKDFINTLLAFGEK